MSLANKSCKDGKAPFFANELTRLYLSSAEELMFVGVNKVP